MVMSKRVYRSSRVFACLCALVAAAGAYADLPEVVFEITAELDPVSVTIPVLGEWFDYNECTDTWTWATDGPQDFMANDLYLGTLSQFSAEIVGDPEINLNFAVQAGPAATTFHIASAVLDDFDPISNAQGYAHASYTLTDFDGNQADLTGIGDTGGAYLAQYNGWAGAPMGPTGTTFAEGIESMHAGFIETVDQDFDHPESGFVPIGDTVESMSALVSFELSAEDLASGTSNFVIIPEPAALVSLALIAGFALRRR